MSDHLPSVFLPYVSFLRHFHLVPPPHHCRAVAAPSPRHYRAAAIGASSPRRAIAAPVFARPIAAPFPPSVCYRLLFLFISLRHAISGVSINLDASSACLPLYSTGWK